MNLMNDEVAQIAEKIIFDEGIESVDPLRQIVCSFMADEFPGMTKSEIDDALKDQTDNIYDDWSVYAEDNGFSSPEHIAAGWEMIFGNEFIYISDLGKFY